MKAISPRFPALVAVILLTITAFMLSQGGQVKASPSAPPQNGETTAQRTHRINSVLGFTKSDLSIVNIQQGPDQSITAIVTVGGRPSTLRMSPRSVRAPGFKLLAQVEGGQIVQVDPGPSRTYWGSIDEHAGSIAAGSLTDSGLFATIRLGVGEQYWIEPIAPRLPGEEPNLYISYRTEDVIDCNGHCGTNDFTHQVPPQNPPGGHPTNGQNLPMQGSGGGGSAGGGVPSLCTALLACDADKEYYTIHGSVNGVNQRIEQVINAVNVEYTTECGITHELGTVLVRTVEPDPYSGGDADSLMDQFLDEWRNNHDDITRDVVHLFTGKNLAGGTIGLGYIGVICDYDYGYSLVESDYDANFGCVTDLTAHELGHNWNAGHCTCVNPPYTMNPFNVCANHFHPTNSIPTITAFRDSVPCLDCGPILELKFNADGAALGEKLGSAIAVVKDVNSDGEPDYIVGCPESDEAGENAGKVYLISGANGAVLWSKLGAAAGDKFGYSVAAFGTKVIVGAPYYGSTNVGRIVIYNAADGTVLKSKNGSAAGDRLGWSVSGGYDINHDGQPDYIVGAPYYDTNTTLIETGAVYAYDGATYALLHKFVGEKKGDHFGWSVAVIGLANSDLFADIVVGAPNNDDTGANAGKVYVYSGATYALLYPAIKGVRAGDQFGRCVAAVGKINSDTRHDFAVGAPYYDNGAVLNAGRAYVFSGSNGAVIFAKTGVAAEDQLGTAISTAGDADGDGRDDVMVSAPLNNSNGADAGKVYVYSGTSGSWIADFDGAAAGDKFGTALAGWKGGGQCRLAITAPLNNGIASDTGRTYVYGTPDAFHAPMTAGLPGTPTCPADIANHDGVVDASDLLAVLSTGFTCPTPCPPSCPTDLNHDCKINADDVQMILQSWGACRGDATTPVRMPTATPMN